MLVNMIRSNLILSITNYAVSILLLYFDNVKLAVQARIFFFHTEIKCIQKNTHNTHKHTHAGPAHWWGRQEGEIVAGHGQH